MNAIRPVRTHLPLRALLLGLCAGLACTLAWSPADETAVDWSLDAVAPLHATLLPEVTVTARISDPDAVTLRIASGAPQAVTLMPTLRVVAGDAPAAGAEALAASGQVPCICPANASEPIAAAPVLAPAAAAATLVQC